MVLVSTTFILAERPDPAAASTQVDTIPSIPISSSSRQPLILPAGQGFFCFQASSSPRPPPPSLLFQQLILHLSHSHTRPHCGQDRASIYIDGVLLQFRLNEIRNTTFEHLFYRQHRPSLHAATHPSTYNADYIEAHIGHYLRQPQARIREPGLTSSSTFNYLDKQCVTKSPTRYRASTYGPTLSTAPTPRSSNRRRPSPAPASRLPRRARRAVVTTTTHRRPRRARRRRPRTTTPRRNTGGRRANRRPRSASPAATSRRRRARTRCRRASRGTRRTRRRRRCCPSARCRGARSRRSTGAGTAAGAARGGTSRVGAAASCSSRARRCGVSTSAVRRVRLQCDANGGGGDSIKFSGSISFTVVPFFLIFL